MRHYTIISGTGRAGTTLLVRILTAAGLDTGFDPIALRVDPISNAGLERDLRKKPNCYIVKSPWIANYIDKVFSDGDIAIDHAIICIRDIHDAAQSRRRVQAVHGHDAFVAGGLVETSDPKDQEEALERLFFRLIFHLTEHEVPLTFLHFPRFANDSSYFVEKLSRVFAGVSRERLDAALRSEVRQELITNFSSRDSY